MSGSAAAIGSALCCLATWSAFNNPGLAHQGCCGTWGWSNTVFLFGRVSHVGCAHRVKVMFLQVTLSKDRVANRSQILLTCMAWVRAQAPQKGNLIHRQQAWGADMTQCWA